MAAPKGRPEPRPRPKARERGPCRPARKSPSSLHRPGVPRKNAAEITPVEPVWVIPAKGAALSETIHAITPIGSRPRVVIIGAGVVGLGHCLAARLAGRRHGVRSRQSRSGSEARGRRHAGGLLRSRARRRNARCAWPREPGALARFRRGACSVVTGVDVELRREGTLVLALTADDQATIAHHLEFQRQLGLPLEWLSAAATRAREPRLAGKIAGALFSPEDHQVDNRKLAQALRIAAQAAGVDIMRASAGQGDRRAGRAGEAACARRRHQRPGRYRRARRRRLVAQHRRIAAGPAAAGASDQRPDAGAADGRGGAAAHARAVGAGRLSRCRGATAG